MNNLIKSVIAAGGYRLSDIRYKVKKLYLLGDITEAEMDELLDLASGGVCIDAERPETSAILHTLAAEIESLKIRIDALEGDGTESSGYPEWMPWNGISKDYPYGAIVSYNGELWQSVFNGQNVWEPGIIGETFWVKHKV